ncbi:hypothetical protein C8J56DRAFT_1065018 [Mycena floridula]|nr:hypothetical protein C8J56DRAFT_1065018 [Mycena floridula]
MCADGRFGPDDYIVWPQAYSHDHAYLAAILRNPRNMTHPLAILWDSPTQIEFIRDFRQMSIGLGHCRPSYLACYAPLLKDLHLQYQMYLSTHSDPNKLAMSLFSSINQAFKCLEFLHMTLRQCIVQLAQFKCLYLELLAVLDWIQKWQPMLNGILPIPLPIEVAPTMGAFVIDDKVVQGFFQVGLPFWHIHGIQKLPHLHIDHLHSVLYPTASNFVTEDNASPPFPVIFTGSATDPGKNVAIERFLASFLRDKDPFTDWKSHTPMSHPPEHSGQMASASMSSGPQVAAPSR